MIKAILFDMDGVLVNADTLHFNALNEALIAVDAAPILWSEHTAIYKGLPTREKLDILAERAGFPKGLRTEAERIKQVRTQALVASLITPDPEKIDMLRQLARDYKICVCSNARRATVEKMLAASGILPFVTLLLGNEDVARCKPHPDVYLKAAELLGVSMGECLIVEDSDVGRQSARASGAHTVFVEGPDEVNYYRVSSALRKVQTPHVVIPAAGQGRRFLEVGYLYPKPLIQVEGEPMIKLVLQNFNGLGDPVVILQRKHIETYCADEVIKGIHPGARIVEVDGLTEGAACTVLAAGSIIDDSRELLLANSDQYLDYDLAEFLSAARGANADGAILTFRASDKKWSYAEIGEDGYVSRVAEKEVISPHATVGVYYFKQGRSFVDAARTMIAKNIRVNNEFYVCPVFNELIAKGARVICHEIEADQMHGLGTPEDLDVYLDKRTSRKSSTHVTVE